jgi:predicted  nucleic acid-binding Zn-ribbon protein
MYRIFTVDILNTKLVEIERNYDLGNRKYLTLNGMIENYASKPTFRPLVCVKAIDGKKFIVLLVGRKQNCLVFGPIEEDNRIDFTKNANLFRIDKENLETINSKIMATPYNINVANTDLIISNDDDIWYTNSMAGIDEFSSDRVSTLNYKASDEIIFSLMKTQDYPFTCTINIIAYKYKEKWVTHAPIRRRLVYPEIYFMIRKPILLFVRGHSNADYFNSLLSFEPQSPIEYKLDSKHRINVHDGALLAYKKEIEELSLQLKNKSVEIEQIKKAKQTSDKELQGAREYITINNVKSEDATKIFELEEELQKLRVDNKVITKEKSDIEAKLSSLSRTNIELTSQIGKIAEQLKISDFEGEEQHTNQNTLRENDQLKKDKEMLEAEKEILEKEKLLLIAKNTKLKGRLSKLNTSLLQKEEEIQKVTLQYTNLQSKLTKKDPNDFQSIILNVTKTQKDNIKNYGTYFPTNNSKYVYSKNRGFIGFYNNQTLFRQGKKADTLQFKIKWDNAPIFNIINERLEIIDEYIYDLIKTGSLVKNIDNENASDRYRACVSIWVENDALLPSGFLTTIDKNLSKTTDFKVPSVGVIDISISEFDFIYTFEYDITEYKNQTNIILFEDDIQSKKTITHDNVNKFSAFLELIYDDKKGIYYLKSITVIAK